MLPVLIWPLPVATARSAMNVSSVSPDRWLMTTPQPGVLRGPDRGPRLAQRPDLVDLDQDRVRRALADGPLQPRLVRDQQVVAHQLEPLPKLRGEGRPA